MRKNQQHISDVIQGFLKEYELDGKMKEIELVNRWEEIVGKSINRHTLRMYLNDKTLYLKLDSSVVRQELHYGKQQLLERINEAMGEALASIGASRVTSLSDAPWPPPWWHHDGGGPLRSLVRWTDLER